MKLHIYKTNRRIKESLYLTACKEQDGKLGSIEINNWTNIEDILCDRTHYVDPGTNVWVSIANELNKPGVFDKLARFVRGQK